MDFLTVIYIVYSFLAFYSLFLFLLLYIKNRKDLLKVPKVTTPYPVSFVIPCYNDEESIGKTIEALMNNGYSNLKRIVTVNDCSTDNSLKIMKEYEKKYPDLIKVVQTPKNTGSAAGAKNYGSKFVQTELIGFTDSDSFPEKGAIEKMIGFFDDENTGAVTASIFVKNRNNFLLRLQALEYMVMKFTRKLFESIDSIYVTPGPLAMYRTKYFLEVGKFDEKNMTEDIEITWRILAKNYGVKMSVPSRVYTVAPDKFNGWFKQRVRWNMGGVQAIIKHKKRFFRENMLGYFVLPIFVSGWVIGLFGLGLLLYRVVKWIMSEYLTTTYSVQAHAALLSMSDFALNPSILFFFGIVLFAASMIFTLLAIFHEKEKGFKSPKVIDILVYTFFYLLTYPVILVASVYKLWRRKLSW